MSFQLSWQINEDGSVKTALSVPKGAEARVILPDHPDWQEKTVGAGNHEWKWQPTKDYLHPFSQNSLMMDLMDNDDAATILKERVPALYEACQGYRNEMRVMKPMQAAGILQMDPDALRGLDEALRAVRI